VRPENTPASMGPQAVTFAVLAHFSRGQQELVAHVVNLENIRLSEDPHNATPVWMGQVRNIGVSVKHASQGNTL